MSCDKTINKILFYFSRLPMQESFFRMMPYLKELVDYKRFEDYLDKWFQQSQQMKEIVVLYTDREPGNHHLFSDLSYLDKSFFDENPVKGPEGKEFYIDTSFKESRSLYLSSKSFDSVLPDETEAP